MVRTLPTTDSSALQSPHVCGAACSSALLRPSKEYACLQMTTLNESPVLLLLETTPQPGQRDLPVRLFESG